MSVTKEQAIAELKRRGAYASVSKEQAIAELKRRGAYEEPSHERSIGKSLAKGTRNVAAGLMEIPDLIATPIREGLNLGAKALGSDYRFRPLSENVAQGIDTATQGYTAPETKSDKTTEAITRSLSSLPVGGMIGKVVAPIASGVGSFLRGSSAITPGNVAATAGASGLMQNELNENPDDTLGVMGMGLLGGVGGGLTGGSLSALSKAGRQSLRHATGEKFGQMTGIQPSKIEDFTTAGVNPLMADVTDSKAVKGATHSLEHIPYVGKNISRAKEAQRSAIEDALDIEGAMTRKRAGEMAAEGAKSFQKSKESIHGPIFEKIEADLSKLPDTNVRPTHTFAFFDSLTKKNTNGLMDKKFLATPVGKELNELKKAASMYKGEIPYDHLKLTLEGINDKITTHGLIGKSSQGKLKKLAQFISDDIEDTLEHKFKELGGNVYSNWKQGKKLYRDYATNEIPDLNEMFKKNKKGAISVFEDLISNNRMSGNKAKMILSSLPEKDRIELMNAFQKRLGSQADGPWSLAKWGTEFKKLDPDAQNVLLSPLTKGNQKKVMAVASVVDHIKDTLREANSSKTAYYTTLATLGSGGLTAGAKALAGNFFPVGSMATGLLLGRLGANALSNPKIINWAYQGMRSKDLSHYVRHLSRLEHMGGIHRTVKTEAQRFVNDINEVRD